MKKYLSLLAFALILMPSFASAQVKNQTVQNEDRVPMMGRRGMMSGQAGQQGMQGMQGMMAGMDMCAKMMMGAQMISSDNGGVIILIGNKLLKYDKDLNLVREIEIAMDAEAMRRMFGGNCPMLGQQQSTQEKADQPAQ